jgi:hypothetical protein
VTIAFDRADRGLTEVLADLDDVVDRARNSQSLIGIFPAMYRSVTAEIHEGVQSGFFDDCVRMEYLAVIFADRYLDALRMWEKGIHPPDSWRVAFAAAGDGRRRTITQHLLAGMNAHINLDLGISVSEVPCEHLDDLHADFLRVNDILFSNLDRLQGVLDTVSHRMALIDALGIRLDEKIMEMAIARARDRAWDLAVALTSRPGDLITIVDTRDRETSALGRAILGGNPVVRWLAAIVAHSEPKDVTSVLDAFSPS